MSVGTCVRSTILGFAGLTSLVAPSVGKALTVEVEDVLVYQCESRDILLQRVDDTRYYVLADRLPAYGQRTPDGTFLFYDDTFFARLRPDELLLVTPQEELREECRRVDESYRNAVNQLLEAWHVSGIRWHGILPGETDRDKATEEKLAESHRRAALLNQQVAALRSQLGSLQALLDDAKERDKAARAELSTLGRDLNAALARAAAEQRRRAEVEQMLQELQTR